MVVESEVLNDFTRFFGVFIAEFTVGGAVDLALEVKRDMIVKKMDLKPKIDAMRRDLLDPSRWKELSKETSSKILSCGDGSCWKTFKPIASLISVERASILHQPHGVGSQRHHIVPIGELNGVSIALMSRFRAISKSTDRIFVSHGGQRKELRNK
ncbi:hypothetical protein Tco_1004299 [Tanacetum coccineum]|uniref:Uncharacterized protein n=1 Tax=Tanacetum coccineum TaxID=301880 RepID=A0ABQ5FBJ5_9ASTR